MDKSVPVSQGPTMTFRAVKMLDISLVILEFFLLAVAISVPLDKFIGKFDPKKANKKSVGILLLEVILHIWLLGAIIYMGRNIVEAIPSPFEGVEGLVHSRIKELANGAMFTYFLIFFQTNLRDKLVYLQQRLSH